MLLAAQNKRMLKSTKYFFLPVTVLILCGIVFFVYYQWRLQQEHGYLSCVASIGSEIQKLNAAKDLATNNKDWKILNEEEVTSLMSQVHGYDCNPGNQTLDLWNNKINIALRKPKDRVEIIVWSNGGDGISGTKDDLVAPYGEKVPQ